VAEMNKGRDSREWRRWSNDIFRAVKTLRRIGTFLNKKKTKLIQKEKMIGKF